MKLSRFLKLFSNFVKSIIGLARSGGSYSVEIVSLQNAELLKNKGVLITGGTSGIGFEIAKRILECGGRVVITGRENNSLQKALKKLGNNCFGILWDVRDINLVDDILEKASLHLNGRLNVLINNAGVVGNANFLETSSEDWELCYQTNSKATFFLCQKSCKYWLNQNDKAIKKIINISSQGGIVGATYPYRLSKWDINGLTKGLGLKFASSGILVNSICPGIVKTKMQPSKINNESNFYDELVPIKRHSTPAEVAELAIFMISDRCNFLTGQSIVMDGGFSLK